MRVPGALGRPRGLGLRHGEAKVSRVQLGKRGFGDRAHLAVDVGAPGVDGLTGVLLAHDTPGHRRMPTALERQLRLVELPELLQREPEVAPRSLVLGVDLDCLQ